MSRRNPMNQRYKKETAPKGVSKKSASSAKPARKRAEEPIAEKASTAVSRPSLHPDTPEYRKARKNWWIILWAAGACLGLGYLIMLEPVSRDIPLSDEGLATLRAVFTFFATALILISWWLDFRVLRPMMKAHKQGVSYEEYRSGDYQSPLKYRKRDRDDSSEHNDKDPFEL